MPDIDFSALRQRLYEQGVATGYAERLVAELREHRVDLEAERLVAGDSRAEAAVRARQQLGSDAAIVAQVLARPELRGRWSSVRAALRPLQSIGIAGVYGPGGAVAAPALARWTASISLGAVATVVMLFALARTIAIGF
ncbi:MAG: hypothetical protein OEM78_03240 [Gammaproteobacteria bacterium]|nr:hypothetical protein [Gammaproteobacteria bacterium]